MGCMHTDLKKMMEIKKIHGIVHPSETFFVVDSMIGQDIINSSKVFNEMFSLTGIVLTKMDGDSRGGCALSIKEITGKPIAFLGTGENVKSMEGFHPHKIVSRILGKEDISSLMDDIKKEFSINFQKNIFQKSQKNVYKFNLNDLLEQLNYISSADNIKRILERIPHVGYGLNKFTKDMDETFFKKMRAIIQSMTYEERSNPEIIKGSRKKRISFGSGTKIQEVNFLLKKFQEIKRIEKSLRKRKFLSS
ncbi:hypothetical protein AOQ87_02400 [Candidatus Riesia pediculischaeffi]|uniref:SRP54-type proteins GTP-binding domain-containing protein n=2 Tax=Candidatus Riesia pediculischaeffi TaxID=428411 RepID=A0A1V0HKX8_9ENTR|nr:hypothetical protein AOQ87_02400 [Candidatus Riesia pediculischaeffi]